MTLFLDILQAGAARLLHRVLWGRHLPRGRGLHRRLRDWARGPASLTAVAEPRPAGGWCGTVYVEDHLHWGRSGHHTGEERHGGVYALFMDTQNWGDPSTGGNFAIMHLN